MATKPTINVWTGNSNRYNLSRRGGSSNIKYICVHYTAGTGSAKNNCVYFSGGNRNASADFFIDPDGTIWQFSPDLGAYYTWAVGDGGGKYGITNKNSVSLEFVNTGTAFTSAQINAGAALVQWLMSTYSVSASNVKRHYDASRKSCPLYYVKNPSAWTSLHRQLTTGKVTATTTTTTTTTTSGGTSYTVTASNGLNVRSGAGTSYSIVKTLAKGATVTVSGTTSANGYTWGKLTDGSGYAALDYTTWKPGSPSSSSSTTATTIKANLDVDGYWGPATTKALQAAMRTTQDGIVSNQPSSNKKYVPSAQAVSWQWKSSGYSGGSSMAKAVQAWAGTNQDGYWGTGTSKAVQAKLIKLGFSCGSYGADGYFGTDSCKALQRALNAGKIVK